MIKDVVQLLVFVSYLDMIGEEIFNMMDYLLSTYSVNFSQKWQHSHLRRQIFKLFTQFVVSWKGNILKLNVNGDVFGQFSIVVPIFVRFEE